MTKSPWRRKVCARMSCGAKSAVAENSILNSLVGLTKTDIVRPSLNGLASPFGFPAG